ncbi:hypothetical protein SNE40_022960 [Patella caerulea]|uniref:WAP domain-containing protein n=1 Tax=Patella caerulea TaxID=87958 RepID=A0AAN8G975_PATCE
MAENRILITIVCMTLIGVVYSQFGQDPCLRKRCPYGTGCRIVAKICRGENSSDCTPEPECVPAMYAISGFNPCAVGQPLLNFNGQPLYCTIDQCPRSFYCMRQLGPAGVCCYDFKGYYVGNKLGICRVPRMFGQCKNECTQDQDCGFMHKCCLSSCGGYSCELSYIG